MVKELFLAILLGALLGFGVTGGYIALSKNKTTAVEPPAQDQSLNPSPTLSADNQSDSNTTSPSDTIVTSTSDHKITVVDPQNESMATATTITIKGTTSPNSLVVAAASGDTQNTTADKDGNFVITEFELDAGVNLIQISSLSPTDQQADLELQVTYSSAKI